MSGTKHASTSRHSVPAYDPPPDYYIGKGMSPWEIIDHYDLDFYEGNVLKYLLRYRRKGTSVPDLIKARNYLNKLIERTTQIKP